MHLVELDVHWFGQPRPNYCVPACLKMVLDYARERNGSGVPRLSIKTIARVVKTKFEGTAPKDVENLNRLLYRSRPSVKFKAEFMGRFPTVEKELIEYRPVIVWINSVDPPDIVWHAVVVYGFQPETNHVLFRDPENKNPRDMEVGMFVDKWGIQARLIKVIIGEKEQTHIVDWATTTSIEEEITNE